ncbi:hypothetical protein [Dyella flagellata]|uniref:hypothetical protein n=1 Tax=Dyella flagellata TaxID=1867833 RepID=UPI0024E07C45|nr:hypothetical protein [Dyella flagellata]
MPLLDALKNPVAKVLRVAARDHARKSLSSRALRTACEYLRGERINRVGKPADASNSLRQEQPDRHGRYEDAPLKIRKHRKPS